MQSPFHAVVLPCCLSLFLWIGCDSAAVAFPASQCGPLPEGFLVLEKDGDQVSRQGNLELENARLNPASTTKLALALILLADGFDSDTQLTISDPYIEGTPRSASLSEALLYSSNDYFISLARQRGIPFFRDRMDALGFLPDAEKESWPGELKAIVHAGEATTTPAHQLEFMDSILNLDKSGARELLPLIEWPRSSADRDLYPDLHLYGKTGAWDRTVWFVGGARQKDRLKIVVIVSRGHWTIRKQAIEHFYCRFGQQLPNHPLVR